MDKRAHIAILFDFYGRLLTEKQQEALRLFYEEDLSLAEIGELVHSSRQAVHDLIRRSETILEKYESQLGAAAAYYRRQERLGELEQLLSQLEAEAPSPLWARFHQLWQAVKEGE